MDITTLGNGDDLETQQVLGDWMKEPEVPRLFLSHILSGRGGYFVGDKEISKEEYDLLWKAHREADCAARKEKQFVSADDAFAYAATLDDGVVLDWGRCYAAMEREGLKIGFCIEPQEQPIVTPDDLLARPGPQFILARRDPVGSRFGGCSTDFTDSSKSWSEDEVEVIEDGTGQYQKGQRLHVRVMGTMGARANIGQDWRMKLFRVEDVLMVVAANVVRADPYDREGEELVEGE